MVEIKKPSMILSIGNAYFAERLDDSGGKPTYGTVEGTQTIKSIGVKNSQSSTQIWASGILFDQSMQKSDAQLSVSALDLPHEWLLKMQGLEGTGTDKALIFDSVDDDGREFAFGYTVSYKDGKKLFIWYPRCKLTEHNPSYDTRTENVDEKTQSYTITAMPLEGIISATYDQALVESGTPIGEDAFFKNVIYSKDQAGSLDTPTV